MKTTAAVLVELAKPLELVELELPVLKPGQVLVEVSYSGVCHTQILEARGYRGEDKFLPHCLGHEGTGIVREISAGVTFVKPGDAVVLSWIKGPGSDIPGTVYTWGGSRVNAGAVTTFQKHAIVSENRLTPLPPGVDARQGALLGCAVPTGFGAVFNAAQAAKGQTLAVFGLGGIGLCAVQAARAAGCSAIVAVDVKADKLALAKTLGATHAIDASAGDAVAKILKLFPKGLDRAIESSGRPQAMIQALSCVRAQGGTAVIVGNARQGELLTIDPKQLNQGKRLLGTWGGDNEPARDYPRYGKLIADKAVDLSPLLGAEYAFERINDALDDLEKGRAVRPLVRIGA